MVTLTVKNITDTFSDNSAGLLLFEQIKENFEQGQSVTVSFEGVPYVSTSFVNSAFINLLQEYSFGDIKEKLQIIKSTSQINHLIKERFAFESQRFPVA